MQSVHRNEATGKYIPRRALILHASSPFALKVCTRPTPEDMNSENDNYSRRMRPGLLRLLFG
jgi:hypothetical protein